MSHDGSLYYKRIIPKKGKRKSRIRSAGDICAPSIACHFLWTPMGPAHTVLNVSPLREALVYLLKNIKPDEVRGGLLTSLERSLSQLVEYRCLLVLLIGVGKEKKRILLYNHMRYVKVPFLFFTGEQSTFMRSL